MYVFNHDKINQRIQELTTMNDNNFQWTDETVKEIVTKALDLMHESAKHDCSQEYIDKFKASKQINKEYQITDWIFSKRPCCCKDEDLLKSSCIIKSVRRLSDNLSFSIDEVTEQGSITGFDLRHDTIYVKVKEYIGSYHLSEVQKAAPKQTPLFVTQDGVDLFWGDLYWGVNTHDFAIGRCSAIKEEKNYPRKNFSTKEAAQEWIYWNKPCLSVAEIMANSINMGIDDLPVYSFSLPKLIEISKSKNKQQ